MSNPPTIFVSIAAYQDPLLAWTLDNAWSNARHPERLRFGVVEQATQSLRATGVRGAWGAQLRYVELKPHDARGPCWARAIGFSLYAGETYLAQLDSHMLFDPGWDEQLIATLEDWRSRHGTQRIVVSTYPNGFEMVDGQAVKTPPVEGPIVLRPLPDQVLQQEHPVLMFQGVPTPSEHALPGHHLGAGCLFATGDLAEHVPYDPFLYFHGEEQNLAVRAWTHGFDIVHPVHMPIYHLYRKPGHQDVVHWTESEDQHRSQRWWDRDRQTKDRLARLLYQRNLTGAYGLGRERTLEAFAQASGIDYQRRFIGQPSLLG